MSDGPDGRWSDERLTNATTEDVLDLLGQLHGRVAAGGNQFDELQRFRGEIHRRLATPAPTYPRCRTCALIQIHDLTSALAQAEAVGEALRAERAALLEMLDAQGGHWVPSSSYNELQIAHARAGCWKPWRQVGSFGYIWESIEQPRRTHSPYDASKGGLSDVR